MAFVFAVSSFVVLIGGTSRAGMIGAVVVSGLFCLLFRKQLLEKYRFSIALVLVLSVVFVIMNTISDSFVTNKIKDAVTEKKLDKYVKNISLHDNTFVFETTTEKLTIKFKDNEYFFIDTDMKQLNLYPSDNESLYIFKDPRYESYKIEERTDFIVLHWTDKYIILTDKENALFILDPRGRTHAKIDKPETFGFKGRELFASSRGYIWSRSIPMLKKTLLLGHGPDTYCIYYPQMELDAKINFLFSAYMIVDKPHNWYLQLAINTGIPSLVAMILFLAWYMLKSFKTYVKELKSSEDKAGAAILTGVTGYLVVSIFNDSVVHVAPIFWILLGLGIALVYNKNNKQAKAHFDLS